jgi:PTH1 family peptidyl-tRNA hydrolase
VETAHSWILVPLGNPGEQYAATRHNLGRLMVQRWMDQKGLKPGPIHVFKTGTLYSMRPPFLALVPGTYMNLSGQVCAEAVEANFDPARMILIHDDKDLLLGMGRFRINGSDGGHNGLRSIIEHVGGTQLARLRLGIGPYERPLHNFVLNEWTEEEWARIAALDAPFARFMDALSACEDLAKLPSVVNAETFWI